MEYRRQGPKRYLTVLYLFILFFLLFFLHIVAFCLTQERRSALYAVVAGNSVEAVRYLTDFAHKSNQPSLIEVGTDEDTDISPFYPFPSVLSSSVIPPRCTALWLNFCSPFLICCRFLAAYLGYNECINNLLARGADLWKVDAMLGWTPLHASIYGRSIISILLLPSLPLSDLPRHRHC